MASGAFPQTFPGLGPSSAQSIEDFEAQMAAAKRLPAPTSSSSTNALDDIDFAIDASPPPPRYSGQQQQQQLPPTPSSSAAAAAADHPTLQAGRAWSSESVALFNNACLRHAVANAYDYEQVRQAPPGWAVALHFGFGALGGEGERFTVELRGPYGSKKEAKAAAAEEGLRVLGDALARKGSGGAKRKKRGGAGEDAETGEGGRGGAARESSDEEGEEENENWVGLLGEYCQAEGKPRPLFQEFSLGANYSMECTLPADRPDEPFGGRNVLFNSKRAAKANAARDAVRWLRDEGRMPKKGHPTKKKMKAAAAAQLAAAAPRISFSSFPFPADAGLLPTPIPIGGGDAASATTAGAGNASNPASGGSDSEHSSSGSPDPLNRSPGEQVMILCSKLGCAQPVYKITPDPRVPSMWSGAAFFPHDPAVAPPGQPVGEVRNIYGKKKAREEVAKKVLKHLKAKRAERQRVVEGVLAGAGAGAGAGTAG